MKFQYPRSGSPVVKQWNNHQTGFMRSLRFILFSTKLALTKGHILTAAGAGVASQVCRITFSSYYYHSAKMACSLQLQASLR